MKMLALDLGQRSGWAVYQSGVLADSGHWDFRTSRFESKGAGFLRFRHEVEAAMEGVDVVAVEVVHRHIGTAAAHAYGGFLAVLQAAAHERGVEIVGIPVSDVKRAAVGKGGGKGADKAAVLAAARAIKPGIASEDEADAVFIGKAAIGKIGSGA